MTGMREIEKRQIAEMTITKAQLLAEAAAGETFKYPPARFRVETQTAKNSYLLDKEAAAATFQRYGGEIVEVVTLPELYTEHAKRLGACRDCGAKPGEPCTEETSIPMILRLSSTPARVVCEPHDLRQGRPVPVSKQRAFGLPACTELGCKAAAGKPCINERGLRLPHACRMPQRPTAPVAELDVCATCEVAAGLPCVSPTGRKVKPHRGRAVKAVG